ncbi:hypothetical protein LWF15_16890 [Kineosporia rhizophila]|uniref:FtsX-like permease family protein n=1 Tax=Kineosporia rhizophila TaxID=84633 RepID=UPI001E42C932|nr:FtsX-like permease family protein [Kineosporia rhizophila]MCE0537180.1 hypothetical protein [Kineosporia rhizophila]
MITLLARRAAASWPLLAAVVAVVVIGATLLGVSTRLLTGSADRALSSGLARVEPEEAEVTAYLTDVPGENGAEATRRTEELLTRTLSPLGEPDVRTRASSSMREVLRRGTDPQVAYLSGLSDLQQGTELLSGKWPGEPADGELPAVVLEATAQAMGLEPGDRVHLGRQATTGRRDQVLSTELVVTGVVAPRPDAGWDRDPLEAAGVDPALEAGFPYPVRAYGPLLVDLPTLWDTGMMFDRVQTDALPDLSSPSVAELDQVSAGLAGLDRTHRDLLGDLIGNQRVASALPWTLDRAHAQEATTRSTVLVVVLLGTLLTASALALAGRLVTRSRATHTALFAALGASRAQILGLAAGEALLLALIATAVALPASSLGHSALTRLPDLAAAGLAEPPGLSLVQVLVVLAGSVVLAAVLLLPALQPDPVTSGRAGRKETGALVRSGADVALLVLAGVGFWQLKVQPGGETGIDVVRILAPGVVLLAGAALMVRLTGLPLLLADRLARRSDRLLLPLAAFDAARRPQAAAAALLLVLASAAGTFGVAFAATWQQSQADQADLAVGTDLRVALTGPARAGQSEALTAATGGTVSPAMSRNVIVGNWLGGTGDPPQLVAVNTASAELRGRPPEGKTWPGVTRELAEPGPVTGFEPSGPGPIEVVAQGSSGAGQVISARPGVVVQDPAGLRIGCYLPVFELDGKKHELSGCDPAQAGSKVVAVILDLDLNAPPNPGAAAFGAVPVDLNLRFPGARTAPGQWTMDGSFGEDAGDAVITGVQGELANRGEDTVLSLRADVPEDVLTFLTGHLVVTGFEPQEVVPVAVSQRFADVSGATPGRRLNVTLGTTPVSVRVRSVVPEVPSAPGASAVLADLDSLSRALITRSDLSTIGQAWWVSDAKTPEAAAALGLGEVTSRAQVHQQLSRGPLRIGLPAALIMLVPAALLLAIGGLVMHVVSDLRVRALEVARLRALGLTRRTVSGVLLAQHGGLLAMLVAAGGVVGLVAAGLIGPLLVRSDLGGAPAPPARPSWPWTEQALLLSALLVAGLLVIQVVGHVQVRAADARTRRSGR